MSRAVLIHKADGPGAITVGAREVRQPLAGEVLIRVHAAAVNPADIMMWRTLGGGALPLPFTPGMDAAGEIAAVGPDVEHLAVGQFVMAAIFPGRPEGGAQAELVLAPAASVIPIGALDPVAAATLPMNGLTALEALKVLGLPAGSTLVVTGGAGLLASYAIPLAKRAGLNVIADAGPKDQALVASFGADVVVPRGETFVEAVLEAAPGGADAVFDAASITAAAAPAVRDGGKIVYVRSWEAPPPPRDIVIERVSVGNALQDTIWLHRLAEEAGQGLLKLRVANAYPPEAAMDAYLRLEAGGLRGRDVITFVTFV